MAVTSSFECKLLRMECAAASFRREIVMKKLDRKSSFDNVRESQVSSCRAHLSEQNPDQSDYCREMTRLETLICGGSLAISIYSRREYLKHHSRRSISSLSRLQLPLPLQSPDEREDP